jgi:predicted ATP-dependent endonuclease of OLD family
MFLVSAKVGPFKSINTSQNVVVDDAVTVLVGMNEAGKTVFLQALEKSNDALGLGSFDPVDDYPRKDLPSYLKQHKIKPAEVTVLTYRLSNEELAELNNELHTKLKAGFQFSVTHLYDDTIRISVSVDEKPVIESLLANETLSSDAQTAIKKATSIRAIPTLLKDASLTEDDKVFLTAIEARTAKTEWKSVVQWETWKWLEPRIPKFLYFSDYDLLPSKMNLADLTHRVEQSKNDPKYLQAKHRAVLALLRMADISITDFAKPGGYEQLKAKIEGVSINLTDQIMEFWKQNEDLEVEVDIKPDPDDEAPYNNGSNLYLRIKNRRHRGVSTPFQQRSRGFIWFFSFLVWFDSVQHQIDTSGKAEQRQLILLLDEPGLALHALAQDDFLRYIDELSKRHQVLYTTHSPFMVHSDRLNQVRVVEDQEKIGTVISDNVSGSDPRTIFPLQAALGWTIAQNLFISERNLLVEGPSELIYLKALSALLETQGRTGLRDDVTIVPVGGLDKVVTFVALLGANGLKLAVLHDYRGAPEQKLMGLVKQKMISPKALLNASQFRDVNNIGKDGQPSDTEDLFEPAFYLEHFNRVFAKALNGIVVRETNLPPGDRIIDRLERHIDAAGVQIRPSGGFNHYAVASHFASNPPGSMDSDTVTRFEALFSAVNALF